MTAAVLLSIVVPLSGAIVLIVLKVEVHDRATLDRGLVATAASLRPPADALLWKAGPAGRGPGRAAGPPPPPASALQLPRGHFLRLVDGGGRVIADRAGPPPALALALAAVPPDSRPRTIGSGGAACRVVAIRLGGGGVLRVGVKLGGFRRDARQLRAWAAVVLGGALLVGGLSSALLARVALAPLARLRSAAARIGADSDAPVAVAEDGHASEVGSLAREFDDMVVRLRGAVRAREEALATIRRFAADAGHELRTPLTSLRLGVAPLRRAGELPDGVVETVEGDIERMSRLVDQLQTLARGEAGPVRDGVPVDLADVAEAATDDLRRRHPQVTTALQVPIEAPVVVGDTDGVHAMFVNLLENAARYAGPAPAVTVTVAPGPRAGSARVVVDDDGPGLTAEERTAVLSRFVRGRGATGEGSGLGLSIVQTHARRHDGDLTLSRSPLGGLRAEVTLGAFRSP